MRNEDRKVCPLSAQLHMAPIHFVGQYTYITINKYNLYELSTYRPIQRLSTCGTRKAPFIKKMKSIIIHIKYYLVDLISVI